MVDPLSYFSLQPVLHDWCNQGCGMCHPVWQMMHIKEPLLLIGKSSPCGGSGFHLSLSEWSFTICLTPYNHKLNVLSVLLNKTFPSLLGYCCTAALLSAVGDDVDGGGSHQHVLLSRHRLHYTYQTSRHQVHDFWMGYVCKIIYTETKCIYSV